jgi:hypothetical protein
MLLAARLPSTSKNDSRRASCTLLPWPLLPWPLLPWPLLPSPLPLPSPPMWLTNSMGSCFFTKPDTK